MPEVDLDDPDNRSRVAADSRRRCAPGSVGPPRRAHPRCLRTGPRTGRRRTRMRHPGQPGRAPGVRARPAHRPDLQRPGRGQRADPRRDVRCGLRRLAARTAGLRRRPGGLDPPRTGARRADPRRAPRPPPRPPATGAAVRRDQAPGALRRAGGAQARRAARAARPGRADRPGALAGADDVILPVRRPPVPRRGPARADGAAVRPVPQLLAQRRAAAVGRHRRTRDRPAPRGPRLRRRAAALGRDTYCWTVDDPADVDLCDRSGVRYLATNSPAATRSHLADSDIPRFGSVTAT